MHDSKLLVFFFFFQDGEESVPSWELRVEGRLLEDVSTLGGNAAHLLTCLPCGPKLNMLRSNVYACISNGI